MTSAARQARAHYAIGLTTYADPQQLEEWIRRAAPGANVIYAIGQLGKHATADLARQAQAAGAVNLKQERSGSGTKYIIEKRRTVPAAACTRPKADTADFATPLLREMFLALADCAERGLPCPSNGELAELFELSDREAARYQLGLLVKAGRIAVEGDRHWRVATIVETGLRTAERAA